MCTHTPTHVHTHTHKQLHTHTHTHKHPIPPPPKAPSPATSPQDEANEHHTHTHVHDHIHHPPIPQPKHTLSSGGSPGGHMDPHTHIRTWSHAYTLPSPSTHTYTHGHMHTLCPPPPHTHTHPYTHTRPYTQTHTPLHTHTHTFSGGGSPGGGEGAPHLDQVVAGDALHPQAAGQQGVQHGGHVAVHVVQAQVLLQQLRGDHLTHQRVLHHHRLRRQLPLDGVCNAFGPQRETINSFIPVSYLALLPLIPRFLCP